MLEKSYVYLLLHARIAPVKNKSSNQPNLSYYPFHFCGIHSEITGFLVYVFYKVAQLFNVLQETKKELCKEILLR